MCGIIGYVGDGNASDVIIRGLKYLEYRGYDSSGIALYDGESIKLAKKEGRIVNLESYLNENPLCGNLAIGHTRWATHGVASDRNAHPFKSFGGRFAVVHNGIIENYLELKERLMAEGVTFSSQTDSEVVVQLIEKNYVATSDIKSAILKAVAALKGAFALGIICSDTPDVIYAVRKDNPLIVGVTETEGYICSDIISLQKFLNKVIVLDNKRIAVVRRGEANVYDFRGRPVKWEFTELTPEIENAFMNYECFMDKEMSEIPAALKRATEGYRNGAFEKIDKNYLKRVTRVNIVACGTALHAGMYGEKLIKKFLPEIDVYSEMASEFRYDDIKVDKNTLTITVSQSGETADTLVAMNTVKSRGGKVLTVCNVATSGMVRNADYALLLNAGAEIAVASTKAYNCQDLILLMFVLDWARLKGNITEENYAAYQAEIDSLPDKAEETLALRKTVADYGAAHYTCKSVFYLGRGLDYFIAMEGSLKLKEISYVHSEAYAAGELKHGTLALIENDVLAVCPVTQESLVDKMCSSLSEVKARGAEILVITPFEDPKIAEHADKILKIPRTLDFMSPIIAVIPTQLLAYYVARAKGCDIDRPRNLAKSVTVE